MDYESALEYIHHCIEVGNIVFEMPQDKEIIDAIKIALEKQIPKKLSIWDEIAYKCPTCGKSYWTHRYIGSYCSKCGQKIVKSCCWL